MKAFTLIFTLVSIFGLSCSTQSTSELSHYKVVKYKGAMWEFLGCRRSAAECKYSFPITNKKRAYVLAKNWCEDDASHPTEVIACLVETK